MNILLNGATGKVGRCIELLTADDADLAVVGRGSRERPMPDDVDADVVIDFSRPDALQRVISIAVERRIPLISGTTGLDPDAIERLREASSIIPICHAANFSVGVHVLDRLVREAAGRLGDGFDIELIETHHRHKVDAPSGTALVLARAAAEARGRLFEDVVVTDAHRGSSRDRGAIGIQALRGGDVVGEHEVNFLGAGERITLAHRATDRSLFARGALRAASWLVGKAPGRYGLDDVFGGPTAD